jgi:DNA-binding MarR family transcriptional regulator
MSSDDGSTDIGVLLGIAYGTFKDRLHAHLESHGYDDLGPSFGYVFRALEESSSSLSELAERLEITPQGAHKLVAEMIDRGYVERVDDEHDARVRRLHLSTRGKAALRAARRFHASVEHELVKKLGQTKVTAARAVLEELVVSGNLGTNARVVRLRPF